MKFSPSLFLAQSYQDAWEAYAQLLRQQKPDWDYVLLTASNETQAAAYRTQIDHRVQAGKLPVGVHYAVLPDPGGLRVGSGGATLNALRYVHAHAGGFSGRRVLVIHSGGDSRRVPQYSACGKLFSPVPRLLPDGRRATLFDEILIGMSGVAARMTEGMLVCSGDVLLLCNPLQIDFYSRGAAALSIKADAKTGTRHGVYLRDAQGNVGRFLHKQTEASLASQGAVDARGNVDIDTGAVLMDAELLRGLYALVETDEGFHAFVNERARLSFYADFLYPLASESTLEGYYREEPEGDDTPELRACRTALWAVLHGYAMKLIHLSPGAFIHFGTTRELLSLVTEGIDRFGPLGWSRRVASSRDATDFAVSNSYVSPRASVGAGSYVEDSYVHHGTAIGRGCVVSGVTLHGQAIPDGAVLHGLKLTDGRFVARMYGVEDNPKERMLFGAPLSQPLWSSRLYPVCVSMREAVDATLRAYHDGFAEGVDRISLEESFARADALAILPWQERLQDKVRVESLLEVIDAHGEIACASRVFSGGLTERAEGMLAREAEKLTGDDLSSFGRKVRIYFALARLTGSGAYMDACFETIRASILQGAVEGLRYDGTAALVEKEVTVRLPVRVNWGGGWSDTPPYCMEHGGTVLNAAVQLDGTNPVEAVVRRVPEHRVILASEDNGSYRVFDNVADLQDGRNPYDPFALHKAALIACGIVPYREAASLADICAHLGGGLYLSTQVVNIPRGSGLGTSSILAGACVKALYQCLGRDISENELYNRVLCMEQIMSTGGGWQDQVGGLAPGIKMVTSDAGMHQRIACTPLRISEATLRELDERFCLIYTGQRRLARNLLREIVGSYIGGVPEAVEVLDAIQRVAVLMRFELEKGNVDGFAQLLTEHWALSKRLDAGSSNTCIDQIFLAIEDLIDGQMICGAGGGGFLQVVLRRGVTSAQLRGRLQSAFQDSGVDVWRCTFA